MQIKANAGCCHKLRLIKHKENLTRLLIVRTPLYLFQFQPHLCAIPPQPPANLRAAAQTVLLSIHLKNKSNLLSGIFGFHAYAYAVHQLSEAFRIPQKRKHFFIRNIPRHPGAVFQSPHILIEKLNCLPVRLFCAKYFLIPYYIKEGSPVFRILRCAWSPHFPYLSFSCYYIPGSIRPTPNPLPASQTLS